MPTVNVRSLPPLFFATLTSLSGPRRREERFRWNRLLRSPPIAVVTPLPERKMGPAALERVIFVQRLPVGGELRFHHGTIASDAAVVPAAQKVGGRVGCEHAGAQRLEDALARDRIKG